jgi:hypothetical protein
MPKSGTNQTYGRMSNLYRHCVYALTANICYCKHKFRITGRELSESLTYRDLPGECITDLRSLSYDVTRTSLQTNGEYILLRAAFVRFSPFFKVQDDPIRENKGRKIRVIDPPEVLRLCSTQKSTVIPGFSMCRLQSTLRSDAESSGII